MYILNVLLIKHGLLFDIMLYITQYFYHMTTTTGPTIPTSIIISDFYCPLN
jgi:hypothetical protein